MRVVPCCIVANIVTRTKKKAFNMPAHPTRTTHARRSTNPSINYSNYSVYITPSVRCWILPYSLVPGSRHINICLWCIRTYISRIPLSVKVCIPIPQYPNTQYLFTFSGQSGVLLIVCQNYGPVSG